MQESTFLQAQLAMFFSSPIVRPDKFSYKLIDNIEELFDIIPSISPYPLFQQHFTQSIVNIQGNGFNISITPERMDLFYNKNININIDIKNSFILLASKIIKNISTYTLNRIGINWLIFFEGYDADAYIKSKFLKDKIDIGKELQIKMNMVGKYKNREVNHIKNIYWGSIEKDTRYVQGMFYHQDINTIVSQKSLSQEYIMSFFDNYKSVLENDPEIY